MNDRDFSLTVEEGEKSRVPRSEELERRCQEADIELDFTPTGNAAGYLLKTTSGREEYFLCTPPDKYAAFLRVPFEQFHLLNEYVGVYSYDDNYIEIALSTVRRGGMLRSLRRRVRTEGETVKEEWLQISFGDPGSGGPCFRVGKGSEEFCMLVQFSRRYRIPRPIVPRLPTLQITGVPISRYDKMLERLRSISDSCLFSIASQFDTAFELMDHSERETIARRPTRRKLRENVQLPVPSNRYDSEPLSFYRYALSAVGMPLLQYLALYQALEFYFPRYSYLQAREIAKKVLRMSGFSAHSDPDVDRLVAAIKQHRASDSSRNEKEQLAATLEACVLPQPLIEWVSDMEERKNFFAKARGESRSVTRHVLQLDRPDKFLVSLGNRIYDIRCKIVHAKEERGEMDVILPYSKAATQLFYDIELIRQVAEQVIAVSATQLQL